MHKTITLRVSKEELQQIDQLREHHHQTFKVPISQSQLIRNLIQEKYNEFKAQDELDEKGQLFTEKEQAHKRDMTILDRLRYRKFNS